jgi:hypothetical protein
LFQFNRPYTTHANVKPMASRYAVQIPGSLIPNMIEHLPVTEYRITTREPSVRLVPYLKLKKKADAFCTSVQQGISWHESIEEYPIIVISSCI